MNKPDFKTEADLCAAFIAWVNETSGKHIHGNKVPLWTAYPETAGWDILLVADDGTQIGVEAKLKFNMKVLSQCMPESWDQYMERPGPDFRAVLVPTADAAQAAICAALGLVLFSARGQSLLSQWRFVPDLIPHSRYDTMWHDWNPERRCKLPEYVPDVVAGSSAPIKLTEWKVKALRIMATLEVRGYVTNADFKQHRIDPRVWTGPLGYLVPGTEPGQWVRGKADFSAQHPEVYPKILTEVRDALKEEKA